MNSVPCSTCVDDVAPRGDGTCPRCGNLLTDDEVTGETLLCPNVKTLRLYSQDELDPNQLRDVARHVSSCRKCTSLLGSIQSTARTQRAAAVTVIDTGPAELPTKVGEYEIQSLLGKGGFGIVYKATSPNSDESVAIKVLRKRKSTPAGLPSETLAPSQLETRLDLFRKEAQTLLDLRHPNIVPVYEVDTSADPPFIVSKLMESSLKQRLAEKITAEQAATIISYVARGLHAAHTKGFVHRDIKPENILLDADDFPYITDFGLVLSDDQYGRHAIQAGTVDYMSPEQAAGTGELADARSDVFSLGVVFYEMLTNKRPFVGNNRIEILDRIQTLDPRRPQSLRDDVPLELEQVCLRALSKNPKDRYPSALAMADAIDDVAQASLHRRISAAALEWVRSNKEPRLLPSGPQLDDYIQWCVNHRERLSALETEFLDASTTSQKTSQRRIRVLRTVVGVVVVSLLTAASLLWQGIRKQNTLTTVADLVKASSQALEEDSPQLAALLAKEAMSTSENSNAKARFEADDSMRQAVRRLGGHPIASNVEHFATAENGVVAAACYASKKPSLLVWTNEHEPPVYLGSIRATAIALDRQGSKLAVAEQQTVRIWSIGDEKSAPASFQATTDQIRIHESNVITVQKNQPEGWQLKRHNLQGEELAASALLLQSPSSVRVSPSGNLLACIVQHEVVLFALSTLEQCDTIPATGAHTLSFGIDDDVLYFDNVIGGASCTKFDRISREKTSLKVGGNIKAMDRSPTGQLRLILSANECVTYDENDTEIARTILRGHDGQISAVNSVAGGFITRCATDKTLRRWQEREATSDRIQGTIAAFDPQDNLIILGEKCLVYDLATHQTRPITDIPHADEYTALTCEARQSANGRWLSAFDMNQLNRLTIHDLDNRQQPPATYNTSQTPKDYALRSNGDVVAAYRRPPLGWTRQLMSPVQDPNASRIQAVVGNAVAVRSLDEFATFAPDIGNQILLAHVSLAKPNESPLTVTLEDRELASTYLCFSRDGSRLAAFCDDRKIRFWNWPAVGQPIYEIPSEFAITRLAFVSNTRLVYVRETKSPVRSYAMELLDFTNRNQPIVATIWEDDVAVRHLSASKNGEYLAVSSKRNLIHVLPLSRPAIRSMAQRKIGRKFTIEELNTYSVRASAVEVAPPPGTRRGD